MTDAEHLQKIADKCRANISLLDNAQSDCPPDFTYCRGAEAFYEAASSTAEASWRATVAAIEGLTVLYNETEGDADGTPGSTAHAMLSSQVSAYAHKTLNSILAAWPEKLL